MRKQKLEKRVNVRATTEEINHLKVKAKKAGLSVSRYLVEMGLSTNHEANKKGREEIERAIFHVRKVGVNLNQVAKRLNKGDYVAPEYLKKVLEAQEKALRLLWEEAE